MPFQFAPWFDAHRAKVVALLNAQIVALGGPPRLQEAIAYAVLGGGKRIRPILVLSIAECLGSSKGYATAEDAAVAVELLHAYSLIHDDLPAMDDAATRHGRPACHRVFGDALAILAGDALLTEAFASLSRGDEPALRCKLVYELASACGCRGMVGGQQLDTAGDVPAVASALIAMHSMKTGALLRAACRMGALSAGASEAQMSAATAYGESLGLAFQVTDDVLDVTHSSEQLGKPSGADSVKGKVTFASLLGIAGARQFASEKANEALAAVSQLEIVPGPLRALAEYAVAREM